MARPRGNDTYRIGRRTLLAGAAALSALGAVGCSRVSTADVRNGGDLLERLRAQGFVKLGLAGEQPLSYIGKDGKMTGYAPKVAQRIFERLGVPEVRPFPTEFGSLISGLNSQQFDVVAAGMYINPTRCAQVIFADPEYQMVSAFIVRKGNPMNLNSFEDVAKSGARFATGSGYADIAYAQEVGIKNIMTLPDQLAGVLAVEQGRADVFSGTAVSMRNAVKQAGSRRVEATEEVQAKIDGEPVTDAGAFAFRKAETNLRDAFNRELHKMKDSGELLRIMRPFGYTEEQMTDLTAEEKCRP
ncbi:ectoine/hydroxyectoine ABC transporter substrate-binding protein EhuB [Streptomyces zingiberis]|uniref:Ectoine/hydroxyectoine ABC transporter substrate-binding protein EhuB n=1 Tax=Streptomyces zingiberis TaxID=2053010 RepID=A0ABX1BZK3_9ACTN|nr:ectoine/hydroxyectoine ABC transporter substrate-binding protein EhuB [Streptomyces zingiberis]NJQ01895.1 ectoine/hydroxyectoine ABC transporter substrate-binding protein EhuB [Streptomyces zingiberis]